MSTDRLKKEKRKGLVSLRFRSEAMERIRGFLFFFAFFGIVVTLSLAAASPSEAAAGGLNDDDAVGFAAPMPIVEAQRNLRRLRAAAPARRALLDVMPWDTVVDQPGSVASTVREKERDQ